MKFGLVSLCVGIFVATACNAQDASEFSKKGSLWLGGDLSYCMLKEEHSKMNILAASPILRFFPANHFMVGPNLSWTGYFDDDYKMNLFGIGVEMGPVFELGEGKSFPYFRFGGKFVIAHTSQNYEYDDPYDSKNTENGFVLPIAAGILVPIGNIFTLQIEPNFSEMWIDGRHETAFGVSFGIGGIGHKAAVTFANGSFDMYKYLW